jgi:hypothetical protein
MNAIITEIQNHQYKNRDAYKQDTKDFLHRIREKCKGNDYDRINAVCELLVKLYDDLMESINNAPESEEAINDDAIEGILAIADTCIEEQNEQRRNPDLDVKLEKDLCDILNGHENEELNDKDIAKARVNAFYCLCTKHRRLKDYKKFKKLVDDCKYIIGQDEIFKIMEAYYYIQETANDFNPMKALKLWKDNISATCKRLPAFTQIYTETVVLQCVGKQTDGTVGIIAARRSFCCGSRELSEARNAPWFCLHLLRSTGYRKDGVGFAVGSQNRAWNYDGRCAQFAR